MTEKYKKIEPVVLSARRSLASASGRSKKHSSSEAEILRPHQKAEFAMGVCDRVWKDQCWSFSLLTPLRTALYIESVLVALLNEVSSCKREKVIPVVK
jgi:hypothetical protein